MQNIFVCFAHPRDQCIVYIDNEKILYSKRIFNS